VKIRRIKVQGQPGQTVQETLTQKIHNTKKGCQSGSSGGVPSLASSQVERLPGKHKTISSSHSTKKKKKKKKKPKLWQELHRGKLDTIYSSVTKAYFYLK
jgi:hypothetical protein